MTNPENLDSPAAPDADLDAPAAEPERSGDPRVQSDVVEEDADDLEDPEDDVQPGDDQPGEDPPAEPGTEG